MVVHDWGSALGFDWANRHREAVKGIAFIEAIVAPQGRDHWDKMGMGSALKALRTEAGEAMVLQNNYFIEEILPKAILRKLSDEEMAAYRRPFAAPGAGRRPTLTWPRQDPHRGEPPDVAAIAAACADWLATSDVPKVFLKVEPGAFLASEALVNLVRRWPALTEKTVAGVHFVQEDSPDEIGQAIGDWMGAFGRQSSRQRDVARAYNDNRILASVQQMKLNSDRPRSVELALGGERRPVRHDYRTPLCCTTFSSPAGAVSRGPCACARSP